MWYDREDYIFTRAVGQHIDGFSVTSVSRSQRSSRHAREVRLRVVGAPCLGAHFR